MLTVWNIDSPPPLSAVVKFCWLFLHEYCVFWCGNWNGSCFFLRKTCVKSWVSLTIDVENETEKYEVLFAATPFCVCALSLFTFVGRSETQHNLKLKNIFPLYFHNLRWKWQEREIGRDMSSNLVNKNQKKNSVSTKWVDLHKNCKFNRQAGKMYTNSNLEVTTSL